MLRSSQATGNVSRSRGSITTISMPSASQCLPSEGNVYNVYSNSSPNDSHFSNETKLSKAESRVRNGRKVRQRGQRSLSVGGVGLVGVLTKFFTLVLLFAFLSETTSSIGMTRMRAGATRGRIVARRIANANGIVKAERQTIFARRKRGIRRICIRRKRGIGGKSTLLGFSMGCLGGAVGRGRSTVSILRKGVGSLVDTRSIGRRGEGGRFSSTRRGCGDTISDKGCDIRTTRGRTTVTERGLRSCCTRQSTTRGSMRSGVPSRRGFDSSDRFSSPKGASSFKGASSPRGSSSSKGASHASNRKGGGASKGNSGSGTRSGSRRRTLVSSVQTGRRTIGRTVLDHEERLRSTRRTVQSARVNSTSSSALRGARTRLRATRGSLRALRGILTQGKGIGTPYSNIVGDLDTIAKDRAKTRTTIILCRSGKAFQFRTRIDGSSLGCVGDNKRMVLGNTSRGRVAKTGIRSIGRSDDGRGRCVLSMRMPRKALSVKSATRFAVSRSTNPFGIYIPLDTLCRRGNECCICIASARGAILNRMLMTQGACIGIGSGGSSATTLRGKSLSDSRGVIASDSERVDDNDQVELLRR